MEASVLEDRIRWGMNVAARTLGTTAHAYRPSGPMEPLAPANRFLRLRAAFTSPKGEFSRVPHWGDPLWMGIFDAAYTRAGDYLVRDDGIWFVASQHLLHPVLCVKTNRTIKISRQAAGTSLGMASYGGGHGGQPYAARHQLASKLNRFICGRFPVGQAAGRHWSGILVGSATGDSRNCHQIDRRSDGRSGPDWGSFHR
jgi:hypothetical protein